MVVLSALSAALGLTALAGCEGALGAAPSDGSGGQGGDALGEGGQGGAVGVGVGGAGGSVGSGGSGGGGGSSWQPVETDWCSPGWLGLNDGTCFYAPATITEPSAVLYFLHGMMPPDASPASQQALAEEAAEKYGFVAVFPRGKQGLCAWDPSVTDWYCWPTSRVNVDAHASELLDGWSTSQLVLEGALGLTFKRQYVMGFSNGGYFAAYIGLEGLFPSDGVGVVGAGRSSVDESLMPPSPTPFYIAVGALELQATQDSAANLSFVLGKHAWPNDLITHPNQGHEIHADDFDGAVLSWGFSK